MKMPYRKRPRRHGRNPQVQGCKVTRPYAALLEIPVLSFLAMFPCQICPYLPIILEKATHAELSYDGFCFAIVETFSREGVPLTIPV